MELLTIFFLLSIAGTLGGLVVLNVYRNAPALITKLAGIVSVVSVLVFLGVILAAVNQGFDGADRAACERAGGIWFGDQNLCVDKTKIPQIDYDKK